MLAHAIQRRLARGTTEVELAALIEHFHREIGVVFTVETLEYLERGGCIGRASALAGSLLNVRPILAIQEGEVVAVARVREAEGPRGVRAALRGGDRDKPGLRIAIATEDKPGLRIAIAHADAPEWVGTLSELVWRVRPKAEIDSRERSARS
jgi:fatty acid-binding protein DegV